MTYLDNMSLNSSRQKTTALSDVVVTKALRWPALSMMTHGSCVRAWLICTSLREDNTNQSGEPAGRKRQSFRLHPAAPPLSSLDRLKFRTLAMKPYIAFVDRQRRGYGRTRRSTSVCYYSRGGQSRRLFTWHGTGWQFVGGGASYVLLCCASAPNHATDAAGLPAAAAAADADADATRLHRDCADPYTQCYGEPMLG